MEISWLEKAQRLSQNATDFILITILKTHGSAPRKEGAKMIVCEKEQHGSIGGGKLEWEVSKLAHKMLEEKQKQKTQDYHLGASLGQCCGGKVSVLLEGFFSEKKLVVVFGAGHIAKALVPILQMLNFRFIVVDTRKNTLAELPKDTPTICSEYPQDEVANFPKTSCYVVVTHEHNLDFAIAEEVLKQKEFYYLGIVGSQKKSLRFQKLFFKKGYAQEVVDKIHCPIGLKLGKTQKPPEIALCIAAQLLEKMKNTK
jgi:xanthine dehydrogenase accessory factor